ncbi:MAG: TonB family protein, partial [Alcaligenaceae bacterium]
MRSRFGSTKKTMQKQTHKWLITVLLTVSALGCAAPKSPLPSAAMPLVSVSDSPESKPPADRRNAFPVYPPEARRAGQQGKVVVRAFIGLNGTVSQAEIHTSSGHQILDDAAREAILSWSFIPAKRNGVHCLGHGGAG